MDSFLRHNLLLQQNAHARQAGGDPQGFAATAASSGVVNIDDVRAFWGGEGFPTEGKSVEEVEAQRAFIRRNIVDRPNHELVRDAEAMYLVRMMGSDLSINAFACNFKVDGVVNSNVVEANALNSKIYEKVSLLSVDDKISERYGEIYISRYIWLLTNIPS